MRDFSTLLSRLAHRQKQQTLQSQIDKQLLTTLTITDATTEARGLGIQIIQLDEVILPPDEIPFPISEG